MPKFKARPLPDFHDVSLPDKKIVEPTKPAPFKLIVDERGATKTERWEQMVSFEAKGFMLGYNVTMAICLKKIRKVLFRSFISPFC